MKRRTTLSCGHILRRHVAGVALVVLLPGHATARAALAESQSASQVELSGPRGVFVDRERNVLVASPGNNRIVLFKNRPGFRFEGDEWVCSLVPFGMIEGRKGPRLESPFDVAVDSKGRIVVADTGNHAVKVYPGAYDSEERPQTIGRGIFREFSSPEGVAIDERDNIIVFDTGNGKVKILTPEGRVRVVIPAASPTPEAKSRRLAEAPTGGCYLGKGYVAVADRGLSSYSVWRYDPASLKPESCQFIGQRLPPEEAFNCYVRDIAYDQQRGLLAYIVSNFPLRDTAYVYLQAVDRNDPGKVVAEDAPAGMRMPLGGWLENPAGLAFGPQGSLYITDAGLHSVQRIDAECFSVLNAAVHVEARGDRAILEYYSTAETPTLVKYGVVPDYIGPTGSLELLREYEDVAEVFVHAVLLTDLLPSKRYAYRYAVSQDFFCRLSGKAVGNLSRTMCFATQAAPGEIGYLNFPLTVLVAPPAGEAVEAVKSRVSDQLEWARLFFWVNSRMTCNMKPRLTVVEGGWQGVSVPSVEKGAGEMPGLSDFVSRLEGMVRKQTGGALSSSLNLFLISGGGGEESPGITCGLPYTGGAVSFLRYTGDDTWSLITAWQKQLSIMHLASGRGDDLDSVLADRDSDRTMVKWDSGADTLRAMGRQAWLANRYGIFQVTADEDEDGVPDDEPDCPLDEKRFGTSPRAKDTDGDDVTDVEEILASRWARGFPVVRVLADGTTEKTRAMSSLFAPSPSAADTDGDGVADFHDRNRLCPLGSLIRRLNVTVNGKIEAGEWENASSMRIVDAEYNGVLRAAWNGTHLCFCLTGSSSESAPSVRIRIDGSADGFLRGSDNLTFVLEPTNGGSFNVRPEPDAWAAGLGRAPGSTGQGDLPPVAAAWSTDAGKVYVEIGVARSPEVGLNLFAGEEIGFDFELRPKASPVWLRVFEPMTLFRGVLGGRPEKPAAPE